EVERLEGHDGACRRRNADRAAARPIEQPRALRRQPAEFALRIGALGGLGEHVGVDVRREDPEVPAGELWIRGKQAERDGVWLLPGGASCRPQAQSRGAPEAPLALDDVADISDEMCEMVVFAEEAREVGGQRIDEVLRILLGAGPIEIVEIAVEARDAQRPYQPGPP